MEYYASVKRMRNVSIDKCGVMSRMDILLSGKAKYKVICIISYLSCKGKGRNKNIYVYLLTNLKKKKKQEEIKLITSKV